MLKRKSMMKLLVICTSATVLPLWLGGCHARPSLGKPEAAFTITVTNQGPDIHQLEVDYPNASFGRDVLASGASLNYPPKLMGSGPIKVTFNDVMGKSHTATGPVVQEGLHKNLVIAIGEDEGIIFQAMTDKTN